MANIVLKDVGPEKVKVIALYRKKTGLDLKETKDIIDNVPVTLFSEIDETNVHELANEFIALGCTVDITFVPNNNKIAPPTPIPKTSPTERFQQKSSNITYPQPNMINPDDVGNLDRNGLLSVFSDIIGITKAIDSNYEEQSICNQRINGAQKKADEIRTAKSGWVYSITIISAIILGIFLFFSFGLLGAIFGLVTGSIIAYKITANLDMGLNSSKRKAAADEYLSQALPPLQEHLASLQQNVIDIQSSDASIWATDIIGSDLFNTDSMSQLVDLVKSRRADTLKEALNKYDDALHAEHMEAMQHSIKEAAEVSAVEASKQTAQMKEIEKSTHKAATAATASAVFNYGTYKNTKKKR